MSARDILQADRLIEMGETLGVRNWFSFGADCFGHPPRFDRDVADSFVRRIREETAGFAAMPAAGVGDDEARREWIKRLRTVRDVRFRPGLPRQDERAHPSWRVRVLQGRTPRLRTV